MKIRTLIVYDEMLGRRLIRRLMADEGGFQVVGECSDGRSAVESIEKQKPDLVFLDIQMPELDGFGTLRELDPGALPIVIFVTAHDQFALKAFEAHGLDFLLKPLDEDRFRSALRRARTYFDGKQTHSLRNRLVDLMADLPAGQQYISRLMVKAGDGAIFLKAGEIDWIGSEGNYVKLAAGKANYLLRGRIGEIEKRLDPRLFFRIHRSTIVNLDRIRQLKPSFRGDGTVVLGDGTHLVASREYRKKLQQSLGHDL
jgi:two-component system, LytTR family, response regulator